MIITFDGPPGSGKKTNTHKFCDRLEIKYESDLFHHLRTIVNTLDLLPFKTNRKFRLLNWLNLINLTYENHWRDAEISVACNYWVDLIDCVGSDDEIIDSLDKLLQYEKQRLPFLSFYLHVPSDISIIRRVRRSTGFEIEITEDNEDCIPEFVSMLTDRYPFFHIIDANRSEDEVFDEVLRIYNEHTA